MKRGFIKKTLVYHFPSNSDVKIEGKTSFFIKEITTENLEVAISQVRQLSESKLRQFLNRMKHKGDLCFGYFDQKGNCVHYSWVRLKHIMHIHEVNYKFDLKKENAFWIFDCRTHESARGNGLYPAMINFLATTFAQENSINQKPYIDVVANNLASISGIEKAGFKKKYELFKFAFFALKIKV